MSYHLIDFLNVVVRVIFVLNRIEFVVIFSALILDGQETEWTSHKLKSGDLYYYNYKTKESAWIKPENFEASNTQLTKEEVQVRYIVFQPVDISYASLMKQMIVFKCLETTNH